MIQYFSPRRFTLNDFHYNWYINKNFQRQFETFKLIGQIVQLHHPKQEGRFYNYTPQTGGQRVNKYKPKKNHIIKMKTFKFTNILFLSQRLNYHMIFARAECEGCLFAHFFHSRINFWIRAKSWRGKNGETSQLSHDRWWMMTLDKSGRHLQLWVPLCDGVALFRIFYTIFAVFCSVPRFRAVLPTSCRSRVLRFDGSCVWFFFLIVRNWKVMIVFLTIVCRYNHENGLMEINYLISNYIQWTSEKKVIRVK